MPWYEVKEPEVIHLDPNLSPIDYLLARMRDPRTEESVRTRIAVALLPFTTPKLLATANVSEQYFASILDARTARWKAREAKKEPVALPPPQDFRRRF
jgi:hypothetical protein